MSAACVWRPMPIFTIWCYLITSLAYLFLMMPYGLAQTVDNFYNLEPTPSFNLQEKELTTVLRVSNDPSDSYGRFHNLRPEVGLLTSTARTFIQNGVTTEYATQVVGTKLDNGRVYAQYLKKSSRVLFDSSSLPTVVTSWVGDSSSLPQSHNDLYNADRPDWQDQDDHLRKVFVGNTDAINFPSDKRIIEISITNTSSKTHSSRLPLLKTFALNNVSYKGELGDDVKKLAAQKVLHFADLFTYTVKNNFSPSGYSWSENFQNSKTQNSSVEKIKELGLEPRAPKQYYQQLMSVPNGAQEAQHKVPYRSEFLEKRKLATTTYYGFADFTTVVGDSVIVFSPKSSSLQVHLGQVTSIKGEATLGTSSTPQVSVVSITITDDLIVPTVALNTQVSLLTDDVEHGERTISDQFHIEESESTSLNSLSISSDLLNNNTPSLSIPSDEEVSAIFLLLQKSAGISKTKENLNFQSGISSFTHAKDRSTDLIEPTRLSTLGGATTIFFEDDPFANFVDSTPSTENNIASQSIMDSAEVTTEDLNDINITTDAVPNTNRSVETLSPSVEEPTLVTSQYSIISSTESLEIEKTPLSPTIIQSAGIAIKELLEGETVSKNENDCLQTSQVFLTQLPKKVTYFTTHFTSVNSSDIEISSSVEINTLNTFEILETTKRYCIQPTSSTQVSKSSQASQGKPAQEISDNVSSILQDIEGDPHLEDEGTEKELDSTTTPYAEIDTSSGDGAIDEEDESGEEFELIYKTLYTTYTYLTTIFQESSSSVLSHTEVITNIITSTVGDTDLNPIEETNTGISRTPVLTTENKYTALNNLDNIIRKEEDDFEEGKGEGEGEGEGEEEEEEENSDASSLITPTEQLSDLEVNTFHTTYTYFTTIFAEGETEIISRTEVLTNVVTGKPSRTWDSILTSDSARNKEHTTNSLGETLIPLNVDASSSFSHNYSTMIRNVSVASQPIVPENFSSITLVTDVRSSSSEGKGHVINEKFLRHFNNLSQELLDDQISSESNTDEILPSATLLLQTSFTTFTYYTTMYNNNNTNIVSRLETITNVATETLSTAAKSNNLEEATLPVTYFTTFTYWTKLAKDGIISTLSREETISNIITPSSVALEDARTSSLGTSSFEQALGSPAISNISNGTSLSHQPAVSDAANLEPTTYYTTYTYYTTSYEFDQTITNSRFETVTNIITPAPSSGPSMTLTASKSYHSDDNREMDSSSKRKLLLYDFKKIIDADGVSTLFFETQVSPSINDIGNIVEVTSSTSSLYIDESKKTVALTTINTNFDGNTTQGRQYKTGLVRLIEGTRIGNLTTTLYQSRVIGTLIENRYAQIIESTSSFLFEKVPASNIEVNPSKTETYKIEATQETDINKLRQKTNVLESSTVDLLETEDQSEDDEKHLEDDEEGDQNNRARLPFQSKKRTFTPVIRPFASRNRPQFAPKKKIATASSATIITRSDFTPTITATPALKSTGRFSSSKKGTGSSLNNVLGSSSSRRFGRPGKISASLSQTPSSGNATPNSSSFSGGRNRFGGSSRGTGPLGTSSRRIVPLSRSSLAGSASFRPGLSSGYNSNARFRVKPTAAFAPGQSTNTPEEFVTHATAPEDTDEETSTQDNVNEDEGETITENSRRNQNPLLRFRRPFGRPSETTSSQRGIGTQNNLISARRNPLTSRAKASTTPATTTTTTPRSRPRGFQRPTIAAISGRQRPQSSLFPPRGLFQKQDETLNNLNKNDETESKVGGNEDDDDTDYDDDEGEESEGDNSERKRRSNSKTSSKNTEAKGQLNSKNIKTSSRSKREADVNFPSRNNFRSRFRRPQTGSNVSTEERKLEDENASQSSTQQTSVRLGRKNSRFGKKSHSPSSTTAVTPAAGGHRIRPTRPNNGRAQFTLREKDVTTSTKSYQRHNAGSFRRPQTTTSSRRNPSSISNNRRLKGFANNNVGTDSVQRNTNTGSRNRGNNLSSGRSRSSSSRGRNRNELNMDLASIMSDGTITVTHFIPSEVTIPVVNGQLTEYKNVITAKTSAEVLSPQQYTSFIGVNGQPTLALTREESMTNAAGATEITQFILHGSPTSTITFTPTTIRGRKTSFSHVLPSTVYSVEKFVSTVQPQLANAPLANILLSQLLLGNIGLPGQAPTNPLLGAITQPLLTTQTSLTPITDYRTHTSTYVTTIYEGMSTVLPVTFQGKKILTTVFDTTAQTITATEFITDTIVTTPTQQVAKPAQVNSLLLQQLLLQQQLQPQFAQDVQPQLTFKELMSPGSNLQELTSNNIQDREEDAEIPAVEETQLLKTTTRKKQRKSAKSGHRRHKSQVSSSTPESSVITLYVSGRRPGEFSTILSTVQANGDSTLQKRQADINVEKTIAIDDLNDYYTADGSDFVKEYSLPEPFQDPKLVTSSQLDNYLSLNFLDSSENLEQTQTLESIIGDVSRWFAKSTILPGNENEKIENSFTTQDSHLKSDFLE